MDLRQRILHYVLASFWEYWFLLVSPTPWMSPDSPIVLVVRACESQMPELLDSSKAGVALPELEVLEKVSDR